MKSIEEIMAIGNPMTIYTLLTSYKKPFHKTIEQTESEYNPMKHKVMDTQYRKKKAIKVKTNKVDNDGSPLYKTKYVDRCRIAVPAQRLLCERDVGFLLSNNVKYNMKGEVDNKAQELYNRTIEIFNENKIDYFDKKLARDLFRCCECAELWYIVPSQDETQQNEIRVILLSPLRGDVLYPHFDDYNRMDGFARKYVIKDELGQTTIHFDVYTNTMLYKYSNAGSTMQLMSAKPHGFTKIPIVYYRQEETEWECVQPVIERLEELLSNWGDVNDYFGAPTYFFKGKMKGFAEKGEVGRIYQGEGSDTDMKVVSWNSAPESMRQEMANLTNIIFSYSQTPDISFENMKTLGNNTSGAAIRLMFTDPHLKAETKEELFGEMFTRRFNVVKNGIAASVFATPQRIADSLRVTPIFSPYIPKNEMEMLQLINLSTQGKATMSQEEGIEENPMVRNAERTKALLKKENEEAAKMNLFATATSNEPNEE